MVRITGRIGLAVVVVASVWALAGCRNNASEGSAVGKKMMLWNGEDFSGWYRYVSDPNVNVDTVWRISDGVLRCEGQPNGYIRTEQKYKNYHLHLEWRWPEKPTNSGVLLHATGADQVWPPCIECQLKAGSAGDFVLINGTGITVNGTNRQDPARQFVVIPKTSPTAEAAAGRWNSYDIHCKNGSIRCFVNDILMNEGTNATPQSGWICLQSEGSPIEFRNIYLQPAK